MTKYRESKKESSYFPETVAACYFDSEKRFIVPYECEDYYSRIWKWKLVRFGELDGYKRKWLAEYEAKNGEIRHWRNPQGELIAL